MNQSTAILIGAGIIAVAALAAATGSPQAQFGSSNGRYMIVPSSEGYGVAFRIDTATGEVRFCRQDTSNPRCGKAFEIRN